MADVPVRPAGAWAYRCGLYQNSDAACCRHNTVPGPAATRFVFAALRQRVLAPAALAKLKARLAELATAEQGRDVVARQRATDQAALAVVRRKLPVVAKNMALAETPDERAATAGVFNALKAEERQLEERLRQVPAVNSSGPKEQVDKAMAVLDRLAAWGSASDDDHRAIGALVRAPRPGCICASGNSPRGAKCGMSRPGGY